MKFPIAIFICSNYRKLSYASYGFDGLYGLYHVGLYRVGLYRVGVF